MTIRFNGSKAPTETRGGRFPKLELQQGEVGRINILTTSGWEATIRHYVQNVSYVHCHAVKEAKNVQDLLRIEDEGGDPEKCPLCKMLAEGNKRIKLPQRRFAIPVLRYKTGLDGKPTGQGLRYWLEIWILDNRKYWRLQEVVKEWGDKEGRIRDHDLTLTCEDAKYQTMAIGVKRDALWKSAAKEIVAYFKEEVAKYTLADCLGQSLDEEALKRRFDTMERKERVKAGVGSEEGEEEVGAVAEPIGDVFDEEEKDEADSPSPEVPKVDDDEDELSFLDGLD